MGKQTDRRAPASVDRIGQAIRRVRGHDVMLDADLAALYGTTTKRLNEQVRRNLERFPADFMFRLTEEEYRNLRSQFATSSSGAHGGRRNLPNVFSEHGAVMAANVVKGPRAVQMSIVVVRAFVRLRQVLQSHTRLARKLDALETRYDAQFGVVFQAIRELMAPRPASRKRIGFRPSRL